MRTVDPVSRHAAVRDDHAPHVAAARAPDLGQFPCTSCHLGKAIVMADERVKDAHQNIKPVHPKQTGALCSTCHAADNVELLALKSGERATLDHTYRLCAQCHFSQAEAWAGRRAWQAARRLAGAAGRAWAAPTATIRTDPPSSRASHSARHNSSEPEGTTNELLTRLSGADGRRRRRRAPEARRQAARAEDPHGWNGRRRPGGECVLAAQRRDDEEREVRAPRRGESTSRATTAS